MMTFKTEEKFFAHSQRARKLYSDKLRKVVKKFARDEKLELEEWSNNGNEIHFGQNRTTIGFLGVRRQITLIFNPDSYILTIFVTAYQDGDHPEDRKLKSFYIDQFILPLKQSSFLCFQGSLEVAWRTLQSIASEELLDTTT